MADFAPMRFASSVTDIAPGIFKYWVKFMSRNTIAIDTETQLSLDSVASDILCPMEDWRINRLRDLAEEVGGNAALGRLLGYKDGAFVGHMLRGMRPVTEKTINKVHSIHKYRGWFDPKESIGAITQHDEDPGPKKCFEFLGQSLLATDSLTRAQIAPLMQALLDTPDKARELGQRLQATFAAAGIAPPPPPALPATAHDSRQPAGGTLATRQEPGRQTVLDDNETYRAAHQLDPETKQHLSLSLVRSTPAGGIAELAVTFGYVLLDASGAGDTNKSRELRALSLQIRDLIDKWTLIRSTDL